MKYLFLWRHRKCDVAMMTDFYTWGYLCRGHSKIWSA